MKSGYYTDAQGNVKGYWELKEKPVDGEFIWIESVDRPAIHVSSSELKAARIRQIDYEFLQIDNKSIRALRTNDTARLAALEAQATSLRIERAGIV